MTEWTDRRATNLLEILGRVNLCNSGSFPEMQVPLEVLQEAECHQGEGFYRDQWLEFAAKIFVQFDLLEFGTGIGFAWLTDDGKLLLEFLRQYGTDADRWPMWAKDL